MDIEPTRIPKYKVFLRRYLVNLRFCCWGVQVSAKYSLPAIVSPFRDSKRPTAPSSINESIRGPIGEYMNQSIKDAIDQCIYQLSLHWLIRWFVDCRRCSFADWLFVRLTGWEILPFLPFCRPYWINHFSHLAPYRFCRFRNFTIFDPIDFRVLLF